MIAGSNNVQQKSTTSYSYENINNYGVSTAEQKTVTTTTSVPITTLTISLGNYIESKPVYKPITVNPTSDIYTWSTTTQVPVTTTTVTTSSSSNSASTSVGSNTINLNENKVVIAGCAEQSNGVCVKCAYRFYSWNGACRAVNDLCKSWNNNGGCTECYGGYDLSGSDCVPSKVVLPVQPQP